MKLFKKILKLNDHGMTLVELICAVAILGMATTAVGGAMVVSAQNYQRNTIEFEVQQEVQTTTNLIGNMVVDAKTAKWDEGNKTLTVNGDGKEYTIVYNETEKRLEYTQNDGTNTVTGVLAEGVEKFDVDDSNFESSKNVKVDLQVIKDDKTYDATYNTTARNGEVSNYLVAGSNAKIQIERNVVLEPNQTYNFKAELKGISMAEAGGIVWEYGPDFVSKADSTENGNEVSVTLKPSAEGNFSFTVKTANNKKNPDGSDSGVAYASQVVNVKVRRVTGMNNLSPVINGTPATAGATYEFVTNVTGDNLEMDLGAKYDNDYKNPKFVKFEYEMSGAPAGKTASDYVGVVTSYENQNSPMYKVMITNTIPAGAKVTIKATAKHPEGVISGDSVYYNKASQDGNTKLNYTPVVRTYEIDGIDVPGYTPPVSFPAGLERGNDYVFVTTFNPTEAGPNGEPSIKQTFGGEPQYFVRFKEEGGSWTQYYATEEEGTTKKIAAEETRMMLVDKAYDIDVIVIMLDGKKITWPQDSSLLDPSCGFSSKGYTRGWTDAQASLYNSATTHDQYGAYHKLGATEAVFYNNIYDPSDDNYGLPATGFARKVGSKGSPIVLSKSGANSKPNYMNVYFDMINLDQGQYSQNGDASKAFVPVVYKYNATGDSWGDPLDDYKMHIQTGNQSFVISQLQNADAGYYRIGIAIDEYYTTVVSVNDELVPSYADKNAHKWNIFDENGEDGFIYIKIVD